MEGESSYISMEGAGGHMVQVPIVKYNIKGNRTLNLHTGVASKVNPILIEFEIAHAGDLGATFLMWFATDWTNLKGKIGFHGRKSVPMPLGENYAERYEKWKALDAIANPNNGVTGFIELYTFENAKIFSYEEYFTGTAKGYGLKIGVVADVLNYHDIKVDRNEEEIKR